MDYMAIIGHWDLATLSLWLFWIFFGVLVYYLQKENMREGFPLENDDGKPAANPGLWDLPAPKTFRLPHGRGSVTVPDPRPEQRPVAMARGSAAAGYPHVPTGEPMLDGVGAASWAPRRDEPELDGKGHPKIRPMSAIEGFHVAAGRDPRGMPLEAGNGIVVGTVTDMWVDEPEQLVRYLEVALDPAWGEGRRLVPMPFALIRAERVKVRAIFARHFADVPRIRSATEVTKLEEDRISAYFGGGLLHASRKRAEPVFG